MATPTTVKRGKTYRIPVSSLPVVLQHVVEPTDEELQALDVEEGIKNGIFSFEGCRVKEPKLWEERYY